MRRRLSHRLLIVVGAVLAGGSCEHGAPFVPGDYAPTQGFNAPPLVRLTLNPGDNAMPAWLPSEEIVFSAERLDRADRDRCFAVMPGNGAAISRYVCRTSAPDDSLDTFIEASPTALNGGQIAYVRQGSHRFPFPPVSPDVQAIVIAPLADPHAGRDVFGIPYVAPSGRTHWGLSHLHWLDASHLMYVGEDVSYPRGCSSCPPDTVRVGLEIAILDVAAATPTVTIVPGTESASSVTVGANSDTIYFTRENDAAIYRHVFSSGATDSVFDFGSGRPVRDVAWAAGRLFVVVDGIPGVGGDVHVLGPAVGTDSLIQASLGSNGFVWLERPSPSEDGRRFVAQGYAFTVATVAGRVDTSVASNRAIWLYERP